MLSVDTYKNFVSNKWFKIQKKRRNYSFREDFYIKKVTLDEVISSMILLFRS